jgi:hypothetical protein
VLSGADQFLFCCHEEPDQWRAFWTLCLDLVIVNWGHITTLLEGVKALSRSAFMLGLPWHLFWVLKYQTADARSYDELIVGDLISSLLIDNRFWQETVTYNMMLGLTSLKWITP